MRWPGSACVDPEGTAGTVWRDRFTAVKSGEPSVGLLLSRLSMPERAYVLRAVVTGDWQWNVCAHLDTASASTVREALSALRGAGRAKLAGNLAVLTEPFTQALTRGEQMFRGAKESSQLPFLRALGQLGMRGECEPQAESS